MHESLFPIDLMGHNVVEVVGSHEAVLVKVSLAENMVDLILSKILAQLLGHFLQLMHRNLALNR